MNTVVERARWNIAFGRQKGDVLKDKEGITTIKKFAHNMVWLLKKTQAKPTRTSQKAISVR